MNVDESKLVHLGNILLIHIYDSTVKCALNIYITIFDLFLVHFDFSECVCSGEPPLAFSSRSVT